MSRFCIVGSGLTGAITASLLKQNMPHLDVVILEKAKGTGGRFCTSRSSYGSSVDLGAQFITKTPFLSDLQKRCYSQLLETGLLQPLKEPVEGLIGKVGEVENFFCSEGSGSLVKHFLQSAGCKVLFGQRVTRVFASDNKKWKLSCENNSKFEFDAVILTMPVPQVLQLEGILSYIQDKELEILKSVHYSSRFALGLFYDYPTSYFDNIPWIAKYISNDSTLRFCSLDHRKRGSTNFPSVVIHTTKEFGKTHVEKNASAVKDIILKNLEKVLPNFPKPSCIKCHKWKYSQVEKNHFGKPGCIVISHTPLLISGGDGFSYSTFEGCIDSSQNIVKCVMENH